MTRHLAEKSAAEDQVPPLGPMVWAAGSQSELTPSESLATSDVVRDTLLLPSVTFSHFSPLVCSLFYYFLLKLLPALKYFPETFFYLLSLLHFNTSLISFSQPCLLSSFPALSLVILPCLSLFSDFNFPSSHLHCL